MKIKSDLHAGSFLDGAYSYVREALSAIPQFISQADEEAKMLYQQAIDSSQAGWGKITSIL